MNLTLPVWHTTCKPTSKPTPGWQPAERSEYILVYAFACHALCCLPRTRRSVQKLDDCTAYPRCGTNGPIPRTRALRDLISSIHNQHRRPDRASRTGRSCIVTWIRHVPLPRCGAWAHEHSPGFVSWTGAWIIGFATHAILDRHTASRTSTRELRVARTVERPQTAAVSLDARVSRTSHGCGASATQPKELIPTTSILLAWQIRSGAGPIAGSVGAKQVRETNG